MSFPIFFIHPAKSGGSTVTSFVDLNKGKDHAASGKNLAVTRGVGVSMPETYAQQDTLSLDEWIYEAKRLIEEQSSESDYLFSNALESVQVIQAEINTHTGFSIPLPAGVSDGFQVAIAHSSENLHNAGIWRKGWHCG